MLQRLVHSLQCFSIKLITQIHLRVVRIPRIDTYQSYSETPLEIQYPFSDRSCFFARLIIRTLNDLSIDQRIVKLEELLASKPEVAPGMEPAYEVYRGILQKELDNAKAARDHAAQTSKG